MNRNVNQPNNGKVNSKQRSAVRMALATAATLVTLISAQLFASSNTLSQDTSVIATTVQDSSITAVVSSDSDDQITVASNPTATVFTTQSQPIPNTHSSR